MIYTNLSNLPAPLVSAIKRDTYDKFGDISITGLIKPPRMRQLESRYDDWITEDVAEGIWRLIGSIGHAIIERADQDNHLAEERLTMRRLGWTISGKSDLLDSSMLLSDYKFTSVYAFLLGDKPEWAVQLNLYAALYREHGFEVRTAQIVGILRDWQKSRAQREPDYPRVGVIVQSIELWTPKEQEEFLLERIRLHQAAETLADDDLPECTPDERWQRPDVWAVKKKGNKRALSGGLHSTETSAQAFAMIQSAPVELEHRPGASVRCESYCSVAQFCSQWAKIKPAGKIEEEAA